MALKLSIEEALVVIFQPFGQTNSEFLKKHKIK
jgi:hypothetical protein